MARTIAGLLIAACLLSAPQDVQLPKIVGLAHVALYVHDFDSARQFYGTELGFSEPFGLPTMKVFKVNDHQFIEVSLEKEAGTDRLNHYAVEVEDAEAMRTYLASKGVAVPAQVPKGKIGNLNFMIHDPEGRSIEIVQYAAESQVTKTRGQFLPATRISGHMRHVGFVVTKLNEEMAFYTEILGFKEFWRGSAANSSTLSWINMKLPDSDDYVEFMLYKEQPPAERRGSANHLCLLVGDVARAAKDVDAKTGPKVGVNRKRQLNLFDAEGTRTELMEPVTIDGKPAPPSTLPPPD